MEGGREVEALDQDQVSTIIDNILNTVDDHEHERQAIVNAINKKLNYYRQLKKIRDWDY
jgi:hypothetical protein